MIDVKLKKKKESKREFCRVFLNAYFVRIIIYLKKTDLIKILLPNEV